MNVCSHARLSQTRNSLTRMMKEYFEIEASKATPQYEFRKGLKLFGDEGYQAAKHELKANLLRRRLTCSH